MVRILERFLVALCAAALVAAPAVSGSAVASAATLPTQQFTGSSVGTTHGSAGPGVLHYTGGYRSDGQLGNGRISVDIGTPGNPARLTRSDGTTLTGTAKFAVPCGPPELEVCVNVDVSGASDLVHATVFLDEEFPPVNPPFTSFLMSGTLTQRRRLGYVMIGALGDAASFGGVDLQPETFGFPSSPRISPDKERQLGLVGVVAVALTRSGGGYWVANAAGQVYAFGDAPYLGGTDTSALLAGERVTSISPTRTGKGYWLFTADGRALRFGDARRFGDLRSTTLGGPIVGSVATPTGNGYYMVGSDGGVFAFGDAKFRGSMGGIRLNRPVVGLVPTPDNAGYWLVAADGGVFSFNAPFHGSMGSVPLNRPIVTMVPYERAYLMVAGDGGIFNFSSGPFLGSDGNAVIPEPIVAAASTG